MRKAGKCVHYNGTVNERCKAGVNYKELAAGATAYAAVMPCLGPEGFGQKIEKVKCDKFQEPTEAEIAEDKAAMDAAMERHRKVGPLTISMKERYTIPGKGKPKFRGGKETFVCPACEVGTLIIAISGYNGHSQGACSTKGCVSWIE